MSITDSPFVLDPGSIPAVHARADQVAARIESILPTLEVVIAEILELRAVSDQAQEQLAALLPDGAALHYRDGLSNFTTGLYATPRFDGAVSRLMNLAGELE